MEGGPTHHHAHRGGQRGTGSRGPRGIQLPPSPQPGHKASLPSRALTPLVVYYLRKGLAFGRVRIYLSLVSKQTLSSQGRTGAAPVPSSWPFPQQLSCLYDQDRLTTWRAYLLSMLEPPHKETAHALSTRTCSLLPEGRSLDM